MLVQVDPLLELAPNWAKRVSVEPDPETRRQLRRHEATGHPASCEHLLKRLEILLDRVLRPGKTRSKEESDAELSMVSSGPRKLRPPRVD